MDKIVLIIICMILAINSIHMALLGKMIGRTQDLLVLLWIDLKKEQEKWK